jgi:SAM-dependent methyltransferase
MSLSSQKLHLGCFDRVFPGWVNTDITPHIFVSKIPVLPWVLLKLKKIQPEIYQKYKEGIFQQIKYLELGKKFPWDNDIFEYVYISHVLEHLYPEDTLNCISEVYRVMKTGGIFRIAVPDLDRMIGSYDPNQPEIFLAEFFEATQRNSKNQHHWHYNENSLRKILGEIGFREVYKCEYKKGKISEIEVIENRPESLFIEAIK